MRMKKIFLVLAAVALCASTVSAQSKVQQVAQAAASQKWSVGLRATYGVQAVAECFYASDKYLEGRLGLGFGYGAGADFTALHNWNCFNWDWTPNAGKWFLDAGVGANLGGGAHNLFVGVAGDVKFGIKFNKVPIRLAIDYTPVIGWNFNYHGEKDHFHTPGFYNGAISATWCF
jgi:hypothetical protein